MTLNLVTTNCSRLLAVRFLSPRPGNLGPGFGASPISLWTFGYLVIWLKFRSWFSRSELRPHTISQWCLVVECANLHLVRSQSHLISSMSGRQAQESLIPQQTLVSVQLWCVVVQVEELPVWIASFNSLLPQEVPAYIAGALAACRVLAENFSYGFDSTTPFTRSSLFCNQNQLRSLSRCLYLKHSTPQ